MIWPVGSKDLGAMAAESGHASRWQRARLFLARLICLGSPAGELRH